MAEWTTKVKGLRFPEGPVAMPDGSIILVEIAAGRITRVHPDGTIATVRTRRRPERTRDRPDGALYCCNNGGFAYREAGGTLAPRGIATGYPGGRIDGARLKPAWWKSCTNRAITAACFVAPTI
ncbi:hypothetical protein [uncultured Sphingomonas sp.]|uniref:hypothetical protein n=1 Tax=uncultured Sphingomonas sp. TaxID=158754 RepID=UPI0035CAA512